MNASAREARETLSALRNSQAIRTSYPLLVALLADGLVAPNEHQRQSDTPLLEHAIRAMDALCAIEENRPADFPAHAGAFDDACRRWQRLPEVWRQSIRTAIAFMDVSKGGAKIERRGWQDRGIDLSIHNFASAELLPEAYPPTARELIRWHGMIGQYARGEVPWTMFKQIPNDDSDFVDAYVVLNICDTAGVRDNLLDERLWSEFETAIQEWASGEHAEPTIRERARRFANLRSSRGDAQIAIDRFIAMTDALSETSRIAFFGSFDAVSFWYCESAISGLTPSSQLKVIAYALGVARRRGVVNMEDGFHLSFAPIAQRLARGAGTYFLRLFEATFANRALEDVFVGALDDDVLVGVDVQIDSKSALTFELRAADEAQALVTLLEIYESKSSARFHSVLKILCDLYGLRKDTFDRVSNESAYLRHMNSARSDKARMLDYALPGTIVEVGPGGGVVLDLIEQRFPDSNLFGVDVSIEVIDALQQRRQQTGANWKVVHGDAFELPDLFPDGFDCVVFCSVLHEIFSYVEWNGEKFQLDAVGALLAAAYRGLNRGGRILIRDGIAPPDGVRIIRFLDREGPDFLKLFVEQFEGFAVDVKWIDLETVELSHHHAMEFLYCYTWGPSSFPYEVREQYGIATYDDYVSAISRWLPTAKFPKIEPELRSYLQPGYRDGLASKVVVMDEEFRPTELPDSNCLIVIEKP